MTTINRATWVDDDGSGATGTILNNARLQGDIYDKIDQALATLDTKDANQDTAITAAGPHKILSANHTDVTPATLVAGDVLIVDGSGKLVRLPAGANGSLLGVTGGLPGWAVPTAGAWTTIPYSAGIFTAAGSMTWTVDAGDVTTLAYTVIGKTGILAFNLGGTALAGTASGEMYITLPAALTASITTFAFGGRYSPPPSGTWAALMMYVAAGTAKLAMQPFAGGAFTLSASNGAFQGTAIFALA